MDRRYLLKGGMAALLSPALPVSALAAPEWTAAQDRADMMRQLGIKELIPGPSADEKSAYHANYDEAKATPFPDLPDPLRDGKGKAIDTAAAWNQRKRAEIVEALEREVYGRVPPDAPEIRWKEVVRDRQRVGFTPVIARRVIGVADNRAAPDIKVEIRMTVVTPAAATGPVPLLIMFGRDDFPAPSAPDREGFERIDAAIKAMLVERDPALAKVFADHPAYMLHEEPPAFRMPQRDEHGDLPRPHQIIAAGWGYAMLDQESIQPDNGAALRAGVIGLANRGQVRKPDDWGVLRAWAWGASRAYDYLSQQGEIDPGRIGVEGVSRYGKAALVAMAFDQRFAVALVGSSGKGGATLLRRNFGEGVSNLASGMHHWMAGNFLRYDAVSGPAKRSIADLPVDAHSLLALCAPRLVFVSYGIPEQGDAHWLDQKGSYMAVIAASPVFDLLGGGGLDPRPPEMPPVGTALFAGNLAWRQHDGGHTDTPNMTYFLTWASQKFASARPGSGGKAASG